jgi:Na+-transporting methylmalonyl-CoA/oxaloacetate decarboxylase gamma subunit
MAAGLIARIAGMPELIERFDQQDRRSDERHRANTEVLGEISEKVAEVASTADEHTSQLALIADREDQVAKKKASALSWRQGLVFVAVSALLTTAGLAALYVSHVIPH